MTLRISTTFAILAIILLAPLHQAFALSDTDGWYEVYDSTDPVFYGLVEKDGSLFAPSHGGNIISSNDDGASWSTESLTTESLFEIDVSNYGIVTVGGNGEVYTSEDAGDSWQSMTTGITDDLYGVHFNGDEGYAVGRDGAIIYSDEGGQTWSTPLSFTSEDLHDVHTGTDQSWAVGYDGEIVSNSAFGSIFSVQTSGSSEDLFGVTFLDDDETGWAVGSNGTILKTEDAGSTWDDISPGTTIVTLYDVRVDENDSDHIYVVGSENWLESEDGGDSWDVIELDSSEAYRMVSMFQ
jgi:photosystem II stability/assembly factor-like uncharacterized protein